MAGDGDRSLGLDFSDHKPIGKPFDHEELAS